MNIVDFGIIEYTNIGGDLMESQEMSIMLKVMATVISDAFCTLFVGVKIIMIM